MQSLQRSVAVTLLLACTLIQINGLQIPTSSCGRLISDHKPLIRNSPLTSRWPWHAAIYHLDDSPIPSYQCGGTVISSKSVLTAGHCVSLYNAPLDTAKVSVALGRFNLAVDESSSQAFEVNFF